jgi:RNA-directed DNA polymerase
LSDATVETFNFISKFKKEKILNLWVLQGQNSRGYYGELALRRLVTSRKGWFTWRNSAENPYILRSEKRRTTESYYSEVAFALSNT